MGGIIMKNLFLFILFCLNMYAIEKNIAFGIYGQDGQYKGQGIQYYPNIVVTYGNYYLEGLEIGKVLYNEKYKLTTFFKYETVTGFNSKDLELQYRELDDRKAPLLFGFRGKKQLGKITYITELFSDFRSESLAGGLGVSRTFRPHKALFLIPSIKAFYYQDKYTNYYYGISEEESLRTGIEKKDTTEGARLEISLDTLLFFSESLGFALRTTYEFIDENWKSEIVEDNKSLKASLLLIYIF